MGGGLVAHRERDRDRVGAESDMVHGQVGTHDGISNEGEMKSDLELKEMKNGKGREGKICTYLQKSPKPSQPFPILSIFFKPFPTLSNPSQPLRFVS